MRWLKAAGFSLAIAVLSVRAYHLLAPPLGAAIEGSLVDDQGRPVAGARVKAWRDLGAWCGLTVFTPITRLWDAVAGVRALAPERAEAATDAQGHFRLGPVQPGTYPLALEAPGLALAPRSVWIGEVDQSVALRAEPAVSVEGVARAADGAPLPRAKVTAVVPGSGSGRGEASAVADEQGHFRLEGLARARYAIVARTPNGYDSGSTDAAAPATGVEVQVRK